MNPVTFITNDSSATLSKFRTQFSASNRNTVLGLGTPCLDTTIRVTDQFLKKHGIDRENWGQIFELKKYSTLVAKAQKIYKEPYIRTTGGSCSNLIKTLAKIHHSTAFFGKLGDFPEDEFYRSQMQNAGVRLISPPSSIPITQVTAFIGENKERFFRVFPNLSKNLPHSILDKRNKIFQDVRITHFEGFMLKEYSLAFIKRAMQLAQEAGSIVSLDLGCEPITAKYSTEILDILRKVDIVFTNCEEARILLNLKNSRNNAEIAGEILSSCQNITSSLTSKKMTDASVVELRAARICVVKQGSDGALVSMGDYKTHAVARRIEKEDIENTNGAGDCYAAGFLMGFINGCSLNGCNKIGNVLGGTVVTQIGAEISDEVWPVVKKEIEQIVLDDSKKQINRADSFIMMLKISRKIDRLCQIITKEKQKKRIKLYSPKMKINFKNSYIKRIKNEINNLEKKWNDLSRELS